MGFIIWFAVLIDRLPTLLSFPIKISGLGFDLFIEGASCLYWVGHLWMLNIGCLIEKLDAITFVSVSANLGKRSEKVKSVLMRVLVY